MKYTNQDLPAGLGKTERERLSKLLRGTQVTILVAEAANILNMEPEAVVKLLSWYAKKGWLKRIRQGVYLPVALESPTSDIILEEPFVIAEKLFSPCYIGGMNAANFWGLTEQLFRTITVMTQKPVKKRNPNIAGTEYVIHTIKPQYFFGLKSHWFNDVKVQISDPTRTIVDMAIFPQFCGGLRFVSDVFQSYIKSKHKDIDLLIEYLDKAKNGAAIKRIGFLAEKFFSDEENLINYCLVNLTKGYIKLAPNIDCPRLIRRWRLGVPNNWKEKSYD